MSQEGDSSLNKSTIKLSTDVNQNGDLNDETTTVNKNEITTVDKSTNKDQNETRTDKSTNDNLNKSTNSSISDKLTNKSKKKRSNQTESNKESNKKRKKIKKWSKNTVIDKNKLTMFDLISYNPPIIETMKQLSEEDNQDENEKVNELVEDEQIDSQLKDQLKDQLNEKKEKEEEDLSKATEENDEECIGPRVKINENGEIVLDEESLIVKRKKPKDQNIKTVYEDDKTLSTRTNYSSFKKPGKTNEKKLRWTNDETVKFYTALTIIGTDFTLMSDLFFRDQRTRVDLKNKFKQEEKCHKVLIDNALKKSDLSSIQNYENFNLNLLNSDDSDTELNAELNSTKDQDKNTVACET